MRAFNETTHRMCATTRTLRAIINVSDDILEYGYVSPDDALLSPCICCDPKHGAFTTLVRCTDEVKKKLVFSKTSGHYLVPTNFEKSYIHNAENIMGFNNGFPYTFNRYYEAFNNFDLFKDKQRVIAPQYFKLSEYLKYTFGIEFETSMGYVPQDLAYRDGIIPLRDGSISGLEYSTVILNGNEGLNLLYQQVQTLKEYTFFNKECSLHMHFGGYPVNEQAIFVLYVIACLIERDLYRYVPKYTFDTAKYKASGKDYCKLLNRYVSFNNLYEAIAEKEYEGSLYDPHPNDQERNHKWECHSRYVWCNILNMLCYQKGKTVEFRFLRPTYNFYKIYLWIYVFNGFLKYCEKMYGKLKDKSETDIIRSLKGINFTLTNMMNEVYPKNIAECINNGLEKLSYIVINQSSNGDFIGRDISYEEIINEDLLCDIL